MPYRLIAAPHYEGPYYGGPFTLRGACEEAQPTLSGTHGQAERTDVSRVATLRPLSRAECAVTGEGGWAWDEPRIEGGYSNRVRFG